MVHIHHSILVAEKLLDGILLAIYVCSEELLGTLNVLTYRIGRVFTEWM